MGIARISVWGEGASAESRRRWSIVWGWGIPLHRTFLTIKMVSSVHSGWQLISYRLAACFTRILSTCGIEIHWRSFRHFGNYNYFLGKIAGKKTTRKLCYRKDNRAMRHIHGCPENFRDSLTTPTAIISNIFHGLLLGSTL